MCGLFDAAFQGKVIMCKTKVKKLATMLSFWIIRRRSSSKKLPSSAPYPTVSPYGDSKEDAGSCEDGP